METTTIDPGPVPTADFFRDSGSALLRQGKFADAAAVLTNAVEADPADAAAWRLLGGAFASARDYVRAVPAFERAVALAPESAREHYNLALALQGCQRIAEARSSVERALALDPAQGAARALLGSLGDDAAGDAVARTPVASGEDCLFAATTETSRAPAANVGIAAQPPEAPAPPARAPVAAGIPGLSGTPPPTGMPGLASLGGMQTLGSQGAPPPVPTAVGGAPGGLASVGGAVLRDPVAAPPSPHGPTPYGFPPAPGGYQPPGSNAPVPQLGIGQPDFGNSSGMRGDVPPEVAKGFNLGAAILWFWWLRRHNLRPVSWGILAVSVGLGVVNRSIGGSAGGWILRLNELPRSKLRSITESAA